MGVTALPFCIGYLARSYDDRCEVSPLMNRMAPELVRVLIERVTVDISGNAESVRIRIQ
jgi:hypothetical protein